jgi:hypothetical protein
LRGKAGEIRWFNFVLCEIWGRWHNPDKGVHVLILSCLKASVAMETVLNDNKHAYALQGSTCTRRSFFYRVAFTESVPISIQSLYRHFTLCYLPNHLPPLNRFFREKHFTLCYLPNHFPSLNRFFRDISLCVILCLSLDFSDISQGPPAKTLVLETFKHYNYFWQLRTHFKAEKMPLFALTPKGHHCTHAAIQSPSLSPRQGTVWGGT